ncbi:hypothetical protein L917_07827 [Phytophthora nicotianae]|uniref:Uncharacterized protein n=2 Tax=Phytophthora nicotianae TaxID=4792 RepID=W2LC12_PHYNI|nr:hypothetical protein L917_07827 [Phytophthora nicotianae]ETO76379.1 hypothetical protein F444_08235 [Phytophthora nicotianae P1976]
MDTNQSIVSFVATSFVWLQPQRTRKVWDAPTLDPPFRRTTQLGMTAQDDRLVVHRLSPRSQPRKLRTSVTDWQIAAATLTSQEIWRYHSKICALRDSWYQKSDTADRKAVYVGTAQPTDWHRLRRLTSRH